MPFKKPSGQFSSSAFKFDFGFGTTSPLDESVSTLRASARILADVAGVLSKFPFVKPLAAVTVIMCEIFENVKSNDEGWDTLAKQAVSIILTVMYKRQEDPTSLLPSLSTHCDQLIVKLEAVRTKMNQLLNRHWMKKVLRNSTDKDLQVDFKRFLDQACVIFQIQTLMDIDMRITGVQAMLKQLEDKLTSFETKLEDVQASTIKLGERQLLDCLSNISGVQYNPGKVCASGTRLGILCDIETWASDFSPPLVASLRGKAGIGKSTVAHTVAARFCSARCLAASYFFSRDVAMSRPLKHLLPELSRQLAFRIPSYRRALCAALEFDDIPVFPQQQLSKLLIEPLRASLHADTMTRPWIIVLDALDECEDDIRNCILLLTEAIAEFQGKLKLVLTSRPDAAIDAVEKLRQTHILNIDISSMENASDIRIYFELSLRPLRVQRGWPSVDPIQKLVMLAGGLFVWATIVTEFLLESDTLSEEIELILNGTHWEDNPEKRLAQMYYIILEKAYLAGRRENHFRLFLSVLGTVMVVREPQSDVVIGHLTADGVRYEHLRRILMGLSATLYIPPESPVVRATHPSFYRYLTDDCKDPRFAIETGAHSRQLGQRCLTIISEKLHRDMCDLMALSDVPQSHILDLPNRISKCIPQEVQYGCKNWVFHIIADLDTFVDSQSENLLTNFFRLQLLPWVEVMGLLDSLLVAHESLDSLNTWLKKFKPPDHILVESATDALRFLREFNHVISKNAIQVHISALHFTPQSTTIWKNFIKLPSHPTLVKSGAEIKWPSVQLSLSSTGLYRRSLSFSPDGRLLAEIGESDAVGQVPVQIWDLHSFTLVYMIKWYLPAPIGQGTQPKIFFSPDSETLIVLNLHSVRCWGFAQNHEPDIYTIPNDAERTTATVSPDGSTFALGSPNHNIDIWQVKPRIKLYKDKEIGYGCPLSLGGGGTRLLYGLQDQSTSHSNRTLKCWHADTGILVNIPDFQSYQQLLSTDGLLVLLVSAERVCVHDSNTGAMLFQKQYYELYEQSGTLVDVALSPDATHLAVAIAEDGDVSWIHIIEVISGRLKAAYPGTTPFAWSPSSTTLVFQDPSGVIFLWERSTNNDMVLTLSGHRDNQSSHFVISPDGCFLVPQHTKGEIPLLVLTSYTKSDMPQLRFSTDGPEFVNKNGETALLGIMTGSSPLDSAIDDNSESRYLVTAFVISLNGRLIATLSDSGLVTVYNGYTGAEEGTFQTRLTNANSIQFSSDGNFVAITFKPITGDFTSSLRSGSRQSEIWSTASRRPVYHSNIYQILQFYPNGHDLVCASFRKALCINTLNLDKEDVRGSEVPLSKDAIRIHSTLAIASQPDAHRLAAIDLDHSSVYVWDTERRISTGRLEIPQCYEGAPLTDLALSADGRTLAATSLNCILIWTLELDADFLLPTLVDHESFAYHPRPHFPTFSPDSQMLAYTSNDTRKLWDIVKRKPLPIKHSAIDHLWTDRREWYGNHHYCVLQHPRILHFYRAQDMTGFPEAVEDSKRLRCTNADGFTGIFSQPGLEISVPSYKLPISPILLRLNELQNTVSWYWIQKDGRLVLLELPAA